MNHVTIKRENGKKLTTLRSISVTNGALLDHCKQYGPGVYIASWPVQQNAGKGKPRIKREVSKKVFVYDDDCPELPAERQQLERAGVNVVMPRNDLEGMRAVLSETVLQVVQPLSGLMADLKSRLEALEEEDDEEEETEDDEEEEEPDFLTEVLAAMRRPEYAEVTAALFMPTPDDVKFAQIKGALEKNPNLAMTAVMDIVQIVLKKVSQ